MKILFAFALLVNLNLFTMECFNRPYSSINNQNRYTKLFKTSKKKSQKKESTKSNCFDDIRNALAKALTYENR